MLRRVRCLASVVVIYGPKGAGKSWVPDELRRRAGVAHVDADRVVLDHAVVSLEAIGAWDSDWILADRLAAAGYRVLQVRVTARWRSRSTGLPTGGAERCPVTVDEAR